MKLIKLTHFFRLLSLTLLFSILLSTKVTYAENQKHSVDIEVLPSGQIGLVKGNLSSIGSDTLANMMALWGEGFEERYPAVNIQIQAAGSSTAPPALMEQTAQFAPMSRKMKRKEIAAFTTRYGYPPTEIKVAIDALAVFVNRDNPIQGINLQQLDGIFSITLQCGLNDKITRWGGLGLKGQWAKRDFQIFGRNSASGTYGYFKQNVLCHGDFANNVNEQPGSASVVQSVSSSLNGIGYSGFGYRTSMVKMLPIAKQGRDYIAPTMENVTDGKYPLSRYLYIYINKKPHIPLPELDTKFLQYVLSTEGQQVVVKDGYIPLSDAMLKQQRTNLGF
ncbi:phosphate ABC transporter substrate-binding protein [Vibrio sp. SS-MA-C1-2]|uniref:PstS family phosphate ABC transporter substrate-binding protein n=1 Tax=Vibrio sp. SS-MA-C1-2 TaxID=2908646 RepID=UPI001F3246CF|nr:phosphate ABC transporter substrate-binding protein [Vibrio sp. SS-MA-C1-2]UJF18988.1 phosphate ABC transporter substrate-binding protein [Vibrio sp. SS-MA-C1-2]